MSLFALNLLPNAFLYGAKRAVPALKLSASRSLTK